MKTDFVTPAKPPENGFPMEQPITVFKAEQKEYGFRITNVGCLTLRPAVNLPACVIGTLNLSGQQVPVINPKIQSHNRQVPLTSQSCVVLFEHRIGRAAILTGRLFDNVSEVFDLIVEFTDLPGRTDAFYTCVEESPASLQTPQ